MGGARGGRRGARGWYGARGWRGARVGRAGIHPRRLWRAQGPGVAPLRGEATGRRHQAGGREGARGGRRGARGWRGARQRRRGVRLGGQGSIPTSPALARVSAWRHGGVSGRCPQTGGREGVGPGRRAGSAIAGWRAGSATAAS